MAKIQYHFRAFNSAEQHLRQVVNSQPFKDCYEALRLLGQIKARGSREGHHEAVKLFKRVLELNPTDFEIRFEMATLYEQTDINFALNHYEEGIKVI